MTVIEALKFAAHFIINKAIELGLAKKLKATIDEKVSESIKLIKKVTKSKKFEDKTDSIIDYVLDNMKIPLILKPFKFVIRGCLERLIKNSIDKALEKIAD
jgi:hypothetical protein